VDTKAYIESGILEQFVLGATTPEESAEVLKLAASYPEIKEEITRIEQALIGYAESFKTEAPQSIKENLFAIIDKEAAKPEISTPKVEQPSAATASQTTIRSFRPSYFMLAASILLLALSIFVNIWLYQKWKNSQQELAGLNRSQQVLAARLNQSDTRYNILESQLKTQISVMKNPEVKQVVMKGLPLMPEALATIYWNPKTREVFINANALPTNLTDAQGLQLWAIVDGKPVDLGMVPTQTSLESLVQMKNVENASAFAITIEGKNGSPTPTMEKMIVMGAAS
jgi:anti-sigma-K factor RskA